MQGIHRTVTLGITTLFMGFGASSAPAQQVGLLPTPDVSGATVDSEAEYLTPAGFGGEVEYRYTVNSPASAVGDIWMFNVDVSAASRAGFNSSFPRSYPVAGGSAFANMHESANRLAPFDGLKGEEVILVDQRGPAGWNGGLDGRGFIQFAAADVASTIPPGATLGGFVIRFHRPPTIRQISIVPRWILMVDSLDDATDAMLEDAYTIEQSLPVTGFALGPMPIEVGGKPHYDSLATDMQVAETIGWVSNAPLVDALETNLGAALSDVLAGNNGLALDELQNMLDLVAAADPATFRREFNDLVVLNVESLMAQVPNAANTYIPVFTATPTNAELERGSTFTLTMRNFNSALEGEPPIEGLRVLIRCVQGFNCANLDQLNPGPDYRIDATGQQLFQYVGNNVGVDLFEVVHNDFEVYARLALIEVHWTADADLVVPAFVPPLVLAGEGDTIFVTDRTSNTGTIDVTVPTVTTYYISATDPIDVQTATVLGERDVPPLAVGEFSDSVEAAFVIPAGFDGEAQLLAACADTTDEVVESDEANNCSYSELEREFDAAGVVPDPNMQLPILSVAGVSQAEGDVGSTEFRFDVQISSSPASDVTVDIETTPGSAEAGTDFESTSTQVVFAAGTTELVQSVPVIVFGDYDVELDENFTVALSNSSPNAIIGQGNAEGVIENDDLVAVSVSDVTALEGDSGSTDFDFIVMIDQAHPTEPVSVSLQTVDGSALAGSDYLAATPFVQFPAGTTVRSQPAHVTVYGDTTVEPDETFSLEIISTSANSAVIDSQGQAVILNDDSPAQLDCTTATVTPNMLWPPNHKLVQVALGGVLAEDEQPAQIVVTMIEQDEPVNGLGDGDTSPDGFDIGTDTPRLRRERSGTGDGRVYFLSFQASDASTGATCTGTVTVGVPHDQGQGTPPIDSGLRFDSTQP